MNTTVTPHRPIAVGRAARQPLRRIAAWLRARWQHFWLDERMCYLSQASDHADLERRLRAIERGDCRWPC